MGHENADEGCGPTGGPQPSSSGDQVSVTVLVTVVVRPQLSVATRVMV